MQKSLILAHRTICCTIVVVAICVLPGCWVSSSFQEQPAENDKPSATPSQIIPTPTVDIDNARRAFETGGELAYEEVAALRGAMVGAGPTIAFEEGTGITNWDATLQHLDTTNRFTAQLEKCRLKESVGWVAYSGPEWTDDNKDTVPGLARVSVYMYDPYTDTNHKSNEPELHLHRIDEREVSQMRPGQRIRFSGRWTGKSEEGEAVQDVKYELLEDDSSDIPTPTPDELQNLQITVGKSNCYIRCPAYSLTIDGGGLVTFRGGLDTKVEGPASKRLDKAQVLELIREFRRADFFSLDDKYPTGFDAQVITIGLQMNGRSKRVVGTWFGSPRRFHILEYRIDEIVDIGEWIR